MTHLEYLRLLSGFHFVTSPAGNGLDCLRTWEALYVGAIPVVLASGPMDAQYEGLPVLLVGRWSDVTEELLRAALERFRTAEFDLRRLDMGDLWRRIVSTAGGSTAVPSTAVI
jgi:hypothetical protein